MGLLAYETNIANVLLLPYLFTGQSIYTTFNSRQHNHY